jgi:hypothetical protein
VPSQQATPHGEAFSIEFWLRLSNEQPSPAKRKKRQKPECSIIYEAAANKPEDYRFQLNLELPDRLLVFRVRKAERHHRGKKHVPTEIVSRTRLEAGVWHHVVAVHTARAGCRWCGRQFLYVNGMQDNIWGHIESNISLVKGTGKLAVLASFPEHSQRQHGNKLAAARRLQGAAASVSDVRWWGKELSLTEARQLATQTEFFDAVKQGQLACFSRSGAASWPVDGSCPDLQFATHASQLRDAPQRLEQSCAAEDTRETGEATHHAAALVGLAHVVILVVQVGTVQELEECGTHIQKTVSTLPSKFSDVHIDLQVAISHDSELPAMPGAPSWTVHRAEATTADADLYSAAATAAARGAPPGRGSAVLFVKSNVIPEQGWLTSLFGVYARSNTNNASAVIGGKVLFPNGKIFSNGIDYFHRNLFLDMEPLPHHVLRGYNSDDQRSREVSPVHGVSEICWMVPASLFIALGGLGSRLGSFQSADFCLSAKAAGASILSVGTAVVTSTDPENDPAWDDKQVTFSDTEDSSTYVFLRKWRAHLNELIQGRFSGQAHLHWIMHCGGSQGLEGATILQELEPLFAVRANVRRLHECEHKSTLEDMPMAFRDAVERAAHKRPNNVTDNDLAIVLYSRDYREFGRWIPSKRDYLIGRYMFEADR